MKPEIAKKWVAALRSGEFKQGKGTLRDRDDCYCCLGVLCELAVRDRVIPAAKPDSRFISWGDFRYDGKVAVTPYSVGLWAGLHSDVGALPDGRELTVLNDAGKTFSEIADVIEQNVEAL